MESCMSEDNWKNTPVVYEEISDNHENFAQDLVIHISKQYGKDNIPSYLTLENIQKNHFKPLIEKAEPGDIIEYWAWNAGFLRFADGYRLVRNGKQIESIDCRTS